MKQIDGFTLAWWLLQALTGCVVSILSVPELRPLISKDNSGILDNLRLTVIAFVVVMTGVSIVLAGTLVAYNIIVLGNKEATNA